MGELAHPLEDIGEVAVLILEFDADRLDAIISADHATTELGSAVRGASVACSSIIDAVDHHRGPAQEF